MIGLVSVALALVSAGAMLLTQRGRWEGWAVGLATQPVWAALGVVTGAYGMVLTSLLFGAIQVQGIRAWRRGPVA